MSEVQYWSSLENAWAATERCEVTPIAKAVSAPAKSDNSWQLIKSELRVRLLLLDPEPPHSRVICKIYRIPAHLAWRSLGMVSRANREFTALMEAHRHGLPVVCPHSWMEARTLGALSFSAISLELVQGINLETVLQDENTTTEQRQQLARATGILLRKLHTTGMYWGTAYPRNVLLQQGGDIELMVIDTPYAHWHGRDLSGTESALTDLRGMFRAKKGNWGFNQQEQKQLLLGYSADNVNTVEKLQTQVKPRTRLKAKFDRLKQRSANVLISSPRSPGKGGRYDCKRQSYQRGENQFIGIQE